MEQKSTEPTEARGSAKGHSSGEGLGSKHPYLIYLVLVLVLFVFLIVMGYLAVQNGWLPDRGIHSS